MTAATRAPVAHAGAALLALFAAALPGCSIRSIFVDSTYPLDAPAPVPKDPLLTLDAALLPSLQVAFEAPRAAGECLERWAARPGAVGRLWAYGLCRSRGGDLALCGGDLPGWTPGPPPSLDLGCHGLGGRDQRQLALALGELGVGMVLYQTASLGPQAATPTVDPDLERRTTRVMDHAARLHLASPLPRLDPDAPALSLSGGAANGAFLAGWTWTLLWLREKGLAHGSPVQREAIGRYRVGTAHGTSVGTLVGLPLDLYFTDRAPSPGDGPALEDCLRGRAGPAGLAGRDHQDCALALLERNFVATEWELLCAQPGSVLRLLSPSAESLLAFDPLEENTVEPYFERFAGLVTENALLRTAVAVDLQQGAVMGLDERACRLPGVDRLRCLREGVIASVSEPLFTPPRARVWSGLDGAAGERGSWYDGGVGSVNPVALAVRATDGPVISLDTFRANGTPAPPARGLRTIAFSMLTQLGTALIRWETAAARLAQRQRHEERCRLGELLGDRPPCAPFRGLLEVAVPDDLAPRVLFAAGYAFDPVVMRGLFLWGQRAFLRARATLLAHLGWCALAALEDERVRCPGAEGVSPAQRRAVRSLTSRVDEELAAYARWDDPVRWRRHLERRRELLEEHMTTCER